ncbi:hypothetical protein ACI796_21735 [Geodermatophilus sp. SYSU D00525]
MTRLLRAGLLTAAGCLLIAGCGGGDDGGSSASSSSSGAATTTSSASSSVSSSSAPSSSAPPDAAAFCADATPVVTRLSSALEAAESQGVAALPPLLDQAVTAFDGVTAPAEVAADWQAVRDGVAQLRDQVGAIDPDSPDAGAQVDAAVAAVEGSAAGPALSRVGTYYQQNCGTPAAPTS